MPVLSFDLSFDGRPIIELYVSVCSAEREACLGEGRPVPPAVLARALVDTGAGRSHIDVASLARLAIGPVSASPVYTASGGPPVTRRVYLVDLALAGDRPGPIAVDLPVFGSPLADGLRVGALLGATSVLHRRRRGRSWSAKLPRRLSLRAARRRERRPPRRSRRDSNA